MCEVTWLTHRHRLPEKTPKVLNFVVSYARFKEKCLARIGFRLTQATIEFIQIIRHRHYLAIGNTNEFPPVL